MADISAVIETIRFHDRKSYLADYLADMLEDISDALALCRVESSH